MQKNGTSFFAEQPIFILDHQTLDILDVNDPAVTIYGYAKAKICKMNINDLGCKYRRTDLIDPLFGEEESADKIWRLQAKQGQKHYVQFTTHVFNYQGRPARLAVAHEVTGQVEKQEQNPNKFPQIQLFKGEQNLAEIIWDDRKMVKKWSEKAEEIFGWTEHEVIGERNFFSHFVYANELDQARAVIDKMSRSLVKSYTVEGRVRTKTGDLRTCEWYNTLMYDNNDELHSVHSLVHDVTERKESELLFKTLSEKSLVGIYLIQNGKFVYVNPQFAKIFGYEPSEIVDTLGPLDLTHPDDRPWVGENVRRRMQGEISSMQFDFRCLTKQAKTIHVEVHGKRMEYLGQPAIAGTLLDITSNKKTVEHYQASVASFEDLFDSISDAIYILDENRRVIKVNDAATNLTGYRESSLRGKKPRQLLAPGKVDFVAIQQHFENALDGNSVHLETWGKRKNGELYPADIVLNPATYFGRNVVIALARDTSKQHEVQQEIKESREKFSQLFDNAPVGIVMMDKHQEIRTINKAFEDIFGYKKAEIQGLNVDRLIVPSGREEGATQISQNIYEGHASSATARRMRKDGSPVDVLIYGVPVNVDGKTIAIFGIYADITERKSAEKKLKKSLKEKEVLLAEIHHRVKNNLAVITGLLELQQYNTELQEAKNILRESQLRINSIALIHEKLYQNENLSEISLETYLKELLDIIISSMDTNEKEIEISIDSDLINLTINQAIPCGLILNELVTNSYKHAFREGDNGQIHIKLLKKDRQISLIFTDNGCGFPPDFNLKTPDSLGLTLIRTLSRQLEGKFTFENRAEGMGYRLQFEQDGSAVS